MNDDNKKTSLLAQRYEAVNAEWQVPEAQLPALTAHEAISAARRLYRFGYSLFEIRRSFGGKARVTSGRRYNGIRRGVLFVNPGRGWHDLVHDLSHYVHYRATAARGKRESAHRDGHAWVEREMIKYVRAQGWLEGALKRPETEKPVRNVKAENYKSVLARLLKWERRLKRAQTATRKLRQSRRRYEREGMTA